ncbi:MAG: hypothetical protein AAGD92_07820 [Pseudomonadota bacterium]
MKSNAPWSVKGIERDARETAKEAAKAKGMTVGEWLNQMIYHAGDLQSSGGEVEGLKLRDIVTAIEHLHQKVSETSAQNGAGVGELTRKMGDVVERVQRLERVKSSGGDPDLDDRVRRLEEIGGDRDRVDALKALEKAVAQVAVQFNTAHKTSLDRLDATERQIQDLAARIDSAVGAESGHDVSDINFLKTAIDGLSTRIARTERMASEASKMNAEADASTDEEFVRNTGLRLRVLGDEIKRGGDQIRTLETTIGKLSDQIEAAEKRSAETLNELRSQVVSRGGGDTASEETINAAVAEAAEHSNARFNALQSVVEKLAARVENNSAESVAVPEEKEEIAPADPAFDAHTNRSLENDEEDAAEEASAAPDEAPPANDSEDDFFAFADDIDASMDDAPQADDDEFSFDLDGEDRANADAPSAVGDDADILSEVEAAFANKGKAPKSAPPPAAETAPEASAESELDELLAGLEEPVDQPQEELSEPADAADEPPFAADPDSASLDAPPEAPPQAEDKPEDFLKAARRKAREAAAKADAENAGKKRRNLTPKQKAILAARARKKRAAAEEAGTQAESGRQIDANRKKREAAKRALSAQTNKDLRPQTASEDAPDTDNDDEDDEKQGLTARLGSVAAKLPFLGGKKSDEDDHDDDPDTDGSTDRSGDKAALDTLKTTASARPVTLALGIGIFLALGLLFFMIKDLIFAPRDAAAPAARPVAAAPAEPTATTATEEPALEVPAPPAIDPAQLYRDAMTGLSAATTDLERSAAIAKLEEAALLGHPPSQLQLGEFHKNGQFVDQDLTKARNWFERSANGGNVLAMHRVGVMTARGEGGPASSTEAVAWFESAGNRGLVDSQYNLGAIYHPSVDGDPTGTQDAEKSYFWYSLAVRNGDTAAEPLAAGVAAALDADQKARIDAEVAAWQALPSDVAANDLFGAG